MFVRRKKNNSGVISIQIIDKSRGKYRVVKTVGSSSDSSEIERLFKLGYEQIANIVGQQQIDFDVKQKDVFREQLKQINSSQIRVIGPELIFGKLFDKIGFNKIEDELFRHLVITRLVYPVSKLKTTDYLLRYKGISVDVNKIYRFLDKLSNGYQAQAEYIAFAYTKRILDDNIQVVFYDVTTLYFEAEQEDDLRKIGFSKDGKPQQPQILLGLLLGVQGYPIGYQIFEGNTFEGHTLLSALERMQAKFNLLKPTIVADAGLLSKNNIEQLIQNGYEFILGARIKNESNDIKQQILKLQLQDGKSEIITKTDHTRLIVQFATARAIKDEHNRKKGLNRLERQIKTGKLTKTQINNKGYNKYLKMKGDISIEIDYEKYNDDKKWDGLKGYITNSQMSRQQVIENYNQLWQIEKAFRISKTDLRVRPVYHFVRRRIEAHICIAFCAYTVLKELERLLKLKKIEISTQKATELAQTIYAIETLMPDTNKNETIILQTTKEQQLLLDLITINT